MQLILNNIKNLFSVKYITEIFILGKGVAGKGEYFYMDYTLLNEDFTQSENKEYKAKKYDTLKHKLDELLKEYELV